MPPIKMWPNEQVVELGPVSPESPESPESAGPDQQRQPRLDNDSKGQQNRLLPPTNDTFHRLSLSSLSDAGFGPSLSPVSFVSRSPSPTFFRSSPPPIVPADGSSRIPSWLAAFWFRNRGVFFVFFAQLFGSLMNLCARLLEVGGADGGGPPLHPVQLLFVRMSLTTVASLGYMVHARVPHAPLGPPGVRGLLLLRGLTNFVSILCLWSAMMYLPLAEATVFSFLTPSATGYLCHLVMHHPFARREQIASLVALLGVVLIARPTSVVAVLAGEDGVAAAAGVPEATGTAAEATASAAMTAVTALASAASSTADNNTTLIPPPTDALAAVTATQRLIGVGAGLTSVLGAASAYAAIRAIGTRAHPLVSVTYFSACCMLVSAFLLAVGPLLHHAEDENGTPPIGFSGCIPASLKQCALLISVCLLGFCAQFLSTKGMGLERSNRATAMIYTQMLFAASFDRFVFGHVMDAVSLAGCGLIIGGALWAATARAVPTGVVKEEEEGEGAEVHTDDQLAPAHTDVELGHMPVRRHQLDEERGSESESVPMLAAHDSESDNDETSNEHINARI